MFKMRKTADAFSHRRRTVAVIPACSGAGASTFTQLLAVCMAEKEKSAGNVSVVECGGYYYSGALNLEKNGESEILASYVDALAKDNGSLQQINNRYKKVNWLCRRGQDKKNLSFSELYRLIQTAPGDTVLFDLSSIPRETVKDLASSFDRCILVIDPLPSKLLLSSDYIGWFIMKNPGCMLIVNKYNRGVQQRLLDSFLEKHQYLKLPAVNPELIYKAEYNALPLYEFWDNKALLAEIVRRM